VTARVAPRIAAWPAVALAAAAASLAVALALLGAAVPAAASAGATTGDHGGAAAQSAPPGPSTLRGPSGASALPVACAAQPGVAAGAGGSAATPAPEEREHRLRWGVRTYASEFADRVPEVADRIAAATDDAAVREAALRWKLGASTAAMRAGLRPPAHLALVDTWALARQSVRLFDGGPAGAAFGAQQRTVVETARTLAEEADRLACALLDAAAFDAYRGLVASHAERCPIADLSFERASIAMAWLPVAFEVGGVPSGVRPLSAAGAEAIDRVGELARRAPDWIRWSGELSVVEQSRRFGAVGRGVRALVSDPVGEPRELLGRLRGEAGVLLGDADRRWSRAMDALRGDRHSVLQGLLASPLVRDVLEAIAIAVLALLGIGAALGWTVSRALERRRARRAAARGATAPVSTPGSPS